MSSDERISQAAQVQALNGARQFGPMLLREGGIRFQIYAPAVDSVQLALEGEAQLPAMPSSGDGWFSLDTDRAGAGSRYRFRLPDGTEVPDPGSRYQPEDVHGPSEVIDPDAYAWQDAGWLGLPWHEAILYELHVGTFTAEGTFRSALSRLDHVAELGVTAIELMCLADFAGNRNWGYDGVLLYAPDSAYGRPDEVKAFIDAAHARGIMVILDVVYNHLGPEGNYLPHYFPQMLTERHTTPWGQAFNFDGEDSAAVRELVIQNAIYWVREFHVDGLRLDASHAMIDDSPRHVLDELRERVVAAAGGRTVHLILENEQNISERLKRSPQGEALGYTAQWNHDITHLLAAVLSDICAGEDTAETEKLGKALAQGFVIAAQEEGKADPCSQVPPTAFLAFIQTHDLVGNRIFGDRLAGLTSQEAVRAIAAIYLLLPQIPMLFMGEEWAASTPFPYFSDYHGELAEAVRKGRCEELSKLDPAPSAEELGRAPDPQAESTLRSAQLRWNEVAEGIHADWLAWYKRVLAVRRESVIPMLGGLAESCGRYEVIGPGALTAQWTLAGGAELRLAANLCKTGRGGFPAWEGRLLWMEGEQAERWLGPWSVCWSAAVR
jgi:malto-oligosyltrehalose trehalohydrolase